MDNIGCAAQFLTLRSSLLQNPPRFHPDRRNTGMGPLILSLAESKNIHEENLNNIIGIALDGSGIYGAFQAWVK